MSSLKFWNSLCNQFGEGIISLMVLFAVYFLVSIYAFYKIGFYN
jgi:hypothetical protein